ncbi:MAG: 3'-5' exonuclease [Marinilabiliales bacterium]|nr:MAG: 3'-5' exonuclease [Marinilabiliales bacterium]
MDKSPKQSEIMFVDIETVPNTQSFSELSERKQGLWAKKASYLLKKEEDTPEKVYEKAGIYAEFGKVICISAGVIKDGTLHIKSFYGDDEKVVLNDFARSLSVFYTSDNHALCAHNGKEFDFPFLCRRMLVHQIPIPKILNTQGKKPWEVNHIDTMELWKFGDYKNFTSLDLLTELFDIPSPKDDISGADVARVYYEENDLKRIVEYCQKDVVSLTQVYMRLTLKPLIQDVNILG